MADRDSPDSTPRTSPVRGWYWMPAAVLALGAASLIMIVVTSRIHDRLIRRDQVRVTAVAEVQLALATAHLWVEELVTGDVVDPQEIAANLDTARDLVDALLDRAVSSAEDDLQPLTDSALRTRAAGIRDGVARFREISTRRQTGFARGDPVGIGSEIDGEYDRVFAALRNEARALESTLRERQTGNHRRARLLFRTILASWAAIVVLAVAGLWTHERRRVRAEQALGESRAQLLQAQKMEAVGRLAGGIAHDINNYLGAIRAQSELLAERPSPPERVVQKTRMIVDVVGKASSLIERLLAFSRRQPIQPVVLDLNGVIREGVGPMIHRLIGEDILLDTTLDPELWPVRIDPSEVEQVIVNLVVNARDAMPAGGRLEITTANRTVREGVNGAGGPQTAGDYVTLVVSDTGAGIPVEHRQRIFEPFFTTKDAARSSGLGLSTVYGIVERARGTVTFESEIDRGTTFTVWIPRSKERPVVLAGSAAGPLAESSGSGRVLVVEDNDELRQSTREVVEILGYDVTEARDGFEAFEVFARDGDRIDLIVTDVVMPGMTGKELIDRIRRSNDAVRVLFVSGYSDDVMLRHGIERGEVAFLKKPFSADDLARKIRELIRDNR